MAGFDETETEVVEITLIDGTKTKVRVSSTNWKVSDTFSNYTQGTFNGPTRTFTTNQGKTVSIHWDSDSLPMDDSFFPVKPSNFAVVINGYLWT